jgi:hypothetical protein
MAFRRTIFSRFELANGAYRNALVTFYKVDLATKTRTSSLATVYDAVTNGDTVANPYRLDGNGKASDTLYIEEPVIAVIGESELPDQETGIYYPVAGDYQGEWVTEKVYYPGDTIKDGAAGANTKNIYISTSEHTSGVWNTDLNALKWEIQIDVADIETKRADAETSAGEAEAAEATATTKASEASDDADAAAAALVAIQALAGSVPALVALNYLRGNAAGTAVEYRTPAQVLADIGAMASVNDHLSATTNPGVNNDGVDTAGLGTTFQTKSLWRNTSTSEFFVCLDNSTGAAIWETTTLDLTDLGSMATQNADSIAVTGGTVGVGVKHRSYDWLIREQGAVTAGDDQHVTTFRRDTRLHNVDHSVTTGTVTIDLKKNGTNIGGINALAVSSTQTETAVNDSSNAYIDFAAGDKLSIDRSSVSGAENLEVWMDIEER